MKRMSIKEVDRFIDKMESADVTGEMARYKENAIQYLNLFCREIEYKGRKSVPVKE